MLIEKKQNVVVIVLGVLLLTLCCSKDKEGKVTGPTVVEVSMTGSLAFPADTLVNVEDVLIGLGDHQAAPDTNGAFDIKGNGGIPGLAMVYDQDTTPMLMGIVPDPQGGMQIKLDGHSTALALAFMNPLVCISDADGAGQVLSILEGLPEMEELKSLLVEKLKADPKALSKEDDDIDLALTEVVVSYLNSYPSTVSRFYSYGTPRLGKRAGSSESAVLIIDPSYEKSGHRLTYVGDAEFKITNSLGRWAWCVTPTDSFYIFPNGVLMDWFLRRGAFPPSERKFTLEVEPNQEDPEKVNVYGWGCHPDPDNRIGDLSDVEWWYAAYGGMSTLLFEFIPHLVSVITNNLNNARLLEMAGNENLPKMHWLVKTSLQEPRTVDRVREYLQAEDMTGLYCFMAKWIIIKIVYEDDFRANILELLGLQLAEGALARLASWANVGAKAIVTVNSITSLAKTVLGFRNSYFKTTFKIWKQTTDFGNIMGGVYEKVGGLSIEGVTVDLEGDEGNPMNPAHQEVTDANGAFYFENIMIGDKTLNASKQGYKSSSVAVTVPKDATVTANITLERESGSVYGKIVNEILLKHSVPDPTFKGEVNLDVKSIGGENESYSTTARNGQYQEQLSPGSYWLVVWHDDYHSDSIQVSVQANSNFPAPRDLLMKPKGTMKGIIHLDMNADGTYEKDVTFDVLHANAHREEPNPVQCQDLGGSPRPVIMVAGSQMGTYMDVITLNIDPALVTGPGEYALGGVAGVGCPAYNVVAGILYLTYRKACDLGFTLFAIITLPEAQPCNCGITRYGSVIFEEFGTELTDVLAGGIYCYGLAGTCECRCCEDLDGDGQEDDWVKDCAKAKMTIEFRVLMGSQYPIPGNLSKKMSTPFSMERLRETQN